MTLSVQERFDLIKEVGIEILSEDDLKALLAEKKKFIAYDGFEPSGNIHIAQGLLRVININKMCKAGAHFKMWVADWHAWCNNKMGGDLEKIRIVGEYFIEVWKACGLDEKNVEFLWASKNMGDEYWKLVLNIGRLNTVPRLIRCSQIMGRSDSDELSGAQLFYPAMQCADIFHLKIDVCQLGMDQRKVNVLAREVAPKLGFKKPIAVHHHMLMGLGQPPKEDANAVDRTIAMKMSKSNPASSIFMTDSPKQVQDKMSKAYCPQGVAKDNPILEYFKYIIFERISTVVVERPEKFGGNLTFSSYKDLEAAFVANQIHPMDLKSTCAKYVNELLAPVQKYFETNARAKKLKEQVEAFVVTR